LIAAIYLNFLTKELMFFNGGRVSADKSQDILSA
jgi:hypothetical protein